MQFKSVGFVVFAGSLGLSVVAKADYAFNSFDVGQGFNPNSGYLVSGVNSDIGPFSVAMEFTSLQSGTLDNLTVAAENFVGDDTVVASLSTDSFGTPGSTLETWTSGSLPSAGSSGPATVFSNVTPGLSLVAGQNYWVTLSANNDGWSMWNMTTNSLSGPSAVSTDGGASWTNTGPTIYGAFSVEVTRAVPEPSSVFVLGIGALGLLCVRRRR